MKDYEKLGVFYLGRLHDLATRSTGKELLLYDSRHLVTHGLVVGMTGSGKTGLCFDIIEEAAIDGIPAVVIDPKGDLGNLLLTFPGLRPEDFEPWVNTDEACRKGMSVINLASQQAEMWRRGLASWDQDGDRLRRLQAAADFKIYTPGSTAGAPVSILKSFSVPPPEVMEDGELLRECVVSTVAGLLGLVGINVDPLKSRESILLSNLLQQAWASNRDLDLQSLIQQVQTPPVERIGIMAVEAFMSSSKRFELAMQLNQLLAAPNFASWREGDPLDPARLLFTESGKPCVAVFSIAHLGDSERMFFVTLLLNQMLSWMRVQSGTSSLRALVYMDEIFGYFPPVANPPSKQPLLTLLKQGRAFGVGVVLATQNPVDLDYKGLANIGSWFVGRLQTDRDKARVMEGLEGAAAGRGVRFDRAAAEQALAGLGSRIFMLHNVHEEGVQVFESRWAMSYLRGPLSRSEIKRLSRSPNAPTTVTALGQLSSSGSLDSQPTTIRPTPLSNRPILPPEVPQVFVPAQSMVEPNWSSQYQPRLIGVAQVRFVDAKLGVDVEKELVAVTEIIDKPVPIDWSASEELCLKANDLTQDPGAGEFEDCAPAASNARNYVQWGKAFVAWVQSSQRVSLFRSAGLKQVSRPGETERDFRIRLQQVAREQRDEAAALLRRKYAPRITQLEERLRRANAARAREQEQAARASMDTVISFGSTLLGAFLGRKAISSANIGRAATTVRSAGRAMGQSADVARAQESIEAVQQQLTQLNQEFQSEADALATAYDPLTERLEGVELAPTRANVSVKLVALAWLPFARSPMGEVIPVYKEQP